MSEARAIPDNLGRFLGALRLAVPWRFERPVLADDVGGDLFASRGSHAATQSDSPSVSPEQTAAVLALVARHEQTPVDELLRSSGMGFDDFARVLRHLQETGLVKLVATPTAQVVEATPLYRQSAGAR